MLFVVAPPSNREHLKLLLGTDTQPKAAASRHGLRAGQRQR